eukprot:PRCOL_00001208-RA
MMALRAGHGQPPPPPPPPTSNPWGVPELTAEQPLSIHRGTVRSVRPFGVFVRMPGYSKDGLVHCSQVSERLDGDPDVEGGPGGPKGATPEAAAALRVADERKVNKLRLIIAEGEECWVKVVRVDGERIALSMKAVSQEDGTDLDPSNALAGAGGGGVGSDEPPPLWSIHQATVTSVRPFGLFVSMSGYRKHGLVFISQVSSYLGLDRGATDEEKIEALQEVAKTGESVYVKVIGVGTDEQGRLKIACSMRVVSQSDGTDKDPNNLVASGDPKTGGGGDAMGGQGGGSLPGASNAPIASIDDPLYLQRFQIHNTYAKTGGTEGYDLLVDDGNDPVPPPVPGPAGAADVAAGAAAALDGDGGDSPLQDGDRALDALLSTRP